MPEKYRRPHSHERVQAVERMQRQWADERDALATVRRFNATLSAKGYVWFWPKIAAALTSKHHWLVIVCDSCGTVVDWICVLSQATQRPPSVSRCAACNARAAMDTVGRASLRWRDTRRFSHGK